MNHSTETTPTNAQTPAWRRSILWRIARWGLIGLAVLFTLAVLFHVEENWRGKRAWKNYKARMEAQGAVFELEKLVPPEVPDDQNFAMTPLLKPILDLNPPGTLDDQGVEQRWRDPEGYARVDAIQLRDRDNMITTPDGIEDVADVPNRPDWWLGQRIDLEAWQRYYSTSTNFPSWPEPRTPAEDVLKALSRYDAEIAELKEAAKRPYARFNIQYDEEVPFAILLPHLSTLRNLARVIQLRAVAELDAGHVDVAFEDVNLLFTLADSIKDEPILISHLVRIAQLQLNVQTVWEGIIHHRWSPEQLAVFSKRLESINLAAELRQSFEAERAFGAEMIEVIVRKPSILSTLVSGTGGGGDEVGALGLLIPRGWWYFEAINHSRAFDEYMLSVLSEKPEDLDVRAIQERYADLEQRMAHLTPVRAFFQHGMLTKLLVPALGKAAMRSVQGQTMIDEAVVALALERHHLGHNAYPESLGALASAAGGSLPNDPITHEPFRYERVKPASYRLWSVGWDRQDDGGVVALDADRKDRVLPDKGDWVWPSAGQVKTQVFEE